MTYSTVKNETTLEGPLGVLTSRGYVKRNVKGQTTESGYLWSVVADDGSAVSWDYEVSAVILPSDVTAGSPGSFPTSPIPYDLAELQSLGALGETTGWTTGQHVVLGDGSQAYWDGDSWEAGTAP